MVWQPSHLMREQMEERRLEAARLLRPRRQASHAPPVPPPCKP